MLQIEISDCVQQFFNKRIGIYLKILLTWKLATSRCFCGIVLLHSQWLSTSSHFCFSNFQLCRFVDQTCLFWDVCVFLSWSSSFLSQKQWRYIVQDSNVVRRTTYSTKTLFYFQEILLKWSNLRKTFWVFWKING